MDSECKMKHDGSIILFSGKDDAHSSGVALTAKKQTAKSLMEGKPISYRLIRARLPPDTAN